MIILNEKKYALTLLDNGLQGNNPYEALMILSKYYYHCLGYKAKKIKSLLWDFLKDEYPNYELQVESWEESINKLATKAAKSNLYEIDGVKITKTELEVINSLPNVVHRKLLFVMLCLAKFYNCKNPENNGWVNTDINKIKAMARVNYSAIECAKKIGDLRQLGFIELPKRCDSINCRVTFVDDMSDGVLFISDFRELGYEYLFYEQGQNQRRNRKASNKVKGLIRCKECGILMWDNKYGNKKYCKDCEGYIPQKVKKLICEDCGEEFEVAGNNKRTTRCPSCYKDYRREKKRLSMQKIREK